MSLSELHAVNAISFECDALAEAAVITGITNYRVLSGAEFRSQLTTGQAWAHFQAMYAINPAATMQTLSVATLGTALGFRGLNLAPADNTTGPFTKLYAIAKQHGGDRQSGQVHPCYKVANGVAFLTDLSCAHQGDLQANFGLMLSAVAQAAPLTQLEDQDLPTTPRDVERFTIGKVLLGVDNGSQITLDQLTNVQVVLAPKVTPKASDSDIYPSMIVIDRYEPVLRFTTTKVKQLKAAGIPLTGKKIDYSHTQIYFRKRSDSTTSGYVANGTAEHIMVTPYDGMAHWMTCFEGQEDGDATATIEIPLVGDSTFPLDVDWTSTYPS